MTRTELRMIAKAEMIKNYKSTGKKHAIYGTKHSGGIYLCRPESIRYFTDKELDEYVDEKTNYFKFFGKEIEFLVIHLN